MLEESVRWGREKGRFDVREKWGARPFLPSKWPIQVTGGIYDVSETPLEELHGPVIPAFSDFISGTGT